MVIMPDTDTNEHLNQKFILGIDIGGSHITAALVNIETGELLNETIQRNRVDSNYDAVHILQQWTDNIKNTLSAITLNQLVGIGVAMPGPFNYKEGISLIKGVNKYDALFGVNIKKALQAALNLDNKIPIWFENDAVCFGVGESLATDNQMFKKIVAITLGTGFGSTFLENSITLKEGKGVPPNGEIYNVPYMEGITEDYISSNWILTTYNNEAAKIAISVFEISQRAILDKDILGIEVFKKFGKHLATTLSCWIWDFNAECLIIGGSISMSSSLFLPAFNEMLQEKNLSISIKISKYMEISAIKGAAALLREHNRGSHGDKSWRKSSQPLMPMRADSNKLKKGQYDLYPSFNIGNGAIFNGYYSLARWLQTQQLIMIDGFVGNDWEDIQLHLSKHFKTNNVSVCWYKATDFEHPTETIKSLVQPFLGEEESVWGKRTGLTLSNFFDVAKLAQLKIQTGFDLHIVIGTGAALANWKSLVYVDIPKNELQYRMRARQRVSITDTAHLSNSKIYKRLYFVDWVINSRHRQSLLNKINVVVDGQWKDEINWAFSEAIYTGLKNLSSSVIRVRPWFEAGTWGGQWLKNHIPQLDQNEVNYAWSFELIVPENGVVLESDGNHLEISFDWLMEKEAVAILGADEKTFGTEFPIRFDYLDTMDGGNLSIQCHPSNDYIRNEFGENFTQDETYYILDCKEDANVYLGFQENINPEKFRTDLEHSANKSLPLTITDYVQVHKAKKHDLYLIPNKTIHSAGKNNLVLEISATPYIFTFKMYDWVRLDLEGNPRPINIDHAFKNLDFSRKGEKVKEELISKQSIIAQSKGYQLIHVPTHAEHFYDVHRIEFETSIKLNTANKCLIMMLVEGESILITIFGKKIVRMNYAETFILPAAVGEFEMINEGKGIAKVIKAFVK